MRLNPFDSRVEVERTAGPMLNMHQLLQCRGHRLRVEDGFALEL
jgi:hypothetical protein